MATEAPGTTGLEFEVPNYVDQFRSSVLGGTEIDVYANSKDQFFYTPLLLVDWRKLKEALDGLPITPDKVMDVPLHLAFQRPDIEAELTSQIRNSGRAITGSVAALPHTFYRITAKVGGREQVLNPSDIPSSEDGVSLKIKFNMPAQAVYKMTGTRAELLEFYEWRASDQQLWGELFSDGFTYTSGHIKALAKFLSNTSVRKELVGDESITDKVVVKTSSSGGGVSLSLPGASLGGGAAQGRMTSERDRKRLLNRNFVSDFLDEHKASLDIQATASPAQIQYVLDTLLARLFELGTRISLEFREIQGKDYEMVASEANYTRVGVIKASDLMKMKPNLEKINDEKANVQYNGVKAEIQKNNTFKTTDDVEWSYTGDALIPTKVNMVLLSESRLSSEFDFSAVLITKGGDRSTVTRFIYPAVWLSEDSDTVFDRARPVFNPIGSIVAFAGPRASIPAGWDLCDGRTMSISDYPELFEAIGYRWGKGPNAEQFLLPNLQGIFLRGADYKKDGDPDVLARVNGQNEVGEVGSYQESAIQQHRHAGIFPSGGASFEHHQYNDRTPATSWTNETGGVVQANVSGETRPKNAYVNFLIRTK